MHQLHTQVYTEASLPLHLMTTNWLHFINLWMCVYQTGLECSAKPKCYYNLTAGDSETLQSSV